MVHQKDLRYLSVLEISELYRFRRAMPLPMRCPDPAAWAYSPAPCTTSRSVAPADEAQHDQQHMAQQAASDSFSDAGQGMSSASFFAAMGYSEVPPAAGAQHAASGDFPATAERPPWTSVSAASGRAATPAAARTEREASEPAAGAPAASTQRGASVPFSAGSDGPAETPARLCGTRRGQSRSAL